MSGIAPPGESKPWEAEFARALEGEKRRLIVTGEGANAERLGTVLAGDDPDALLRRPPEGPPLAELACLRQLDDPGATVLALGSAWEIAALGYPMLRRCAERSLPVRFLADASIGPPGGPADASGPMVEDLGLVLGLPKIVVACPSDLASAAAALRVLLRAPGPVYLRLPGAGAPRIGPGDFELGRARELRPGRDLTIAAIGPPVALALAISVALSEVGLGARVLDLASVKPIDAKALLRAARETGAILTLEEHSVLSGMGSAVATFLAEACPVPVRRLGAPDLFAPPAGDRAGWASFGLSKGHGIEAAYELLRAQGKVQ